MNCLTSLVLTVTLYCCRQLGNLSEPYCLVVPWRFSPGQLRYKFHAHCDCSSAKLPHKANPTVRLIFVHSSNLVESKHDQTIAHMRLYLQIHDVEYSDPIPQAMSAPLIL